VRIFAISQVYYYELWIARMSTDEGRAPECTCFAAFATRCVKEGTEMQGLLETGQRVKMRFCMTSFSCLSGTLRSPANRGAVQFFYTGEEPETNRASRDDMRKVVTCQWKGG
jgi:hypothetical protein